MNLQEILFEIIKEAEEAKVKLGSDEFYIGFNTIINDKQITFNKNNNITLRINNIEATLLKLNEYFEKIKHGGVHYIKYEDLDKKYFINLKSGIYVHYLELLQKDMKERD